MGRRSSSGCRSDRPRGTETVAARQVWLARNLVVGGLVATVALSWGGCTTIKSIFSPPPAPTVPVAPPAPVPPKKEPVAPAPAPTKKEPEAPQPPKKEPETPPDKKDSEASPPVLAPQVGKGDEEQLRRTAVSRIQRTEQLVGQLEGKSLTGEQQERLMTVRSLLGSSRDALTAQDLTKASNLAEKARLLAEELSQAVK